MNQKTVLMKNKINNLEEILNDTFSKTYGLIVEKQPIYMPQTELYVIPSEIFDTQTFYVCSKNFLMKNYTWWKDVFHPEKIFFQEPIHVFAKIIFNYKDESLEADIFETVVLQEIENIKNKFFFDHYQDFVIKKEPHQLVLVTLAQAEQALHSFELLTG